MKIKQTIWNNCEVMKMSNFAVLPIIIPLLAAVIIAFFNKKIIVTRVLSKIFIVIKLFVTAYVTYLVFTQVLLILETGSWVAPYAFVFVVEPLSILLVLSTNILSVVCMFISPRLVSDKKESFSFYMFVFLLL